MKRHEMLLAVLLGYLVLTAGVVWKFDAYGLVGSGAALLLIASFVNVRE